MDEDSSTITTVVVERVAGGTGGGTFGFQPLIVPSSLAKMKNAGPCAPPLDTSNPDPVLPTTPVGAPAPPAPATLTTSGVAPNWAMPSPS